MHGPLRLTHLLATLFAMVVPVAAVLLVAVAPHGRARDVRATASIPPTARIVAVGNTPVSAVVDERTGLVFVLNLNRPPNPDPADAPGGARLVPGTVSVLDPLRGRVLCTMRVGANPASIAVDARTARVFVADRGPTTRDDVHFPPSIVSVLVAGCPSGRPNKDPIPALRTVSVGYHPLQVAVDERAGHAFVIDGGTLRVLDGRTGAVLHTTEVLSSTPPLDAMAVDERDGRVYVAGYEYSGIHIFAAADGRIVRSIRVGAHLSLIAVDTRLGHVFVVWESSEPSEADVLDAASGRVIGTAMIGAMPRAIVADEWSERVFVLAGFTEFVPGDNNISELDARSGALLRTITVGPHTMGMAVDTLTGRLYVASAQGVSVLDGATGAVLRTLPLAMQPSSIVVDERTGQVIVINATGNSVSIVNALR